MKTENDPIVRVDRSLPPIRPDGLTVEAIYPELENEGPDEFDVRQLDQWVHPAGQETSDPFGSTIFECLKENGLIASCLGVCELMAIQKKGPAFCREHFLGKLVLGWRSVTRVTYKNAPARQELVVPYLYFVESENEILLMWTGLNGAFNLRCCTLRFPS